MDRLGWKRIGVQGVDSVDTRNIQLKACLEDNIQLNPGITARDSRVFCVYTVVQSFEIDMKSSHWIKQIQAPFAGVDLALFFVRRHEVMGKIIKRLDWILQVEISMPCLNLP